MIAKQRTKFNLRSGNECIHIEMNEFESDCPPHPLSPVAFNSAVLFCLGRRKWARPVEQAEADGHQLADPSVRVQERHRAIRREDERRRDRKSDGDHVQH